VVPYVVSAKDVTLGYDLRVFNNSASGSSNVAQAGMVSVKAEQRISVSTVAVTPQPGGKCEVSLTLVQGDAKVGWYALDCWTK
jgi:hypothetical protein